MPKRTADALSLQIVLQQTPRLLTSSLIFFLCSTGVAAESDSPPFDFALRVRSESAKVDRQHADAITVKLRAAYEHQFADGLTAMAEVDHVESFLQGKHSDGVTQRADPVIADPRGTELNQAKITYVRNNTEVVIGRQSIVRGDHRFVGDVGFRQNDQTYDGVSIAHETVNGWKVDYSFVDQINRIFGDGAGRRLSSRDLRFGALNGNRPTAQLGRHDVDAHLLRVENKRDYVDLAGFAHFVHNKSHQPFSHRTVGMSADFRYKRKTLKWQGSAMVARQERQGFDSPRHLDFYRWELGVEKRPWLVSLRQARFGSDAGQSFITPLATLHKFQGWTDLFLVTPAQGLLDTSVRLLWRKRPFTVDVRWHDFDTVRGRDAIGRELNVDLIFAPSREHEVKLRYADFDPAGRRSIRPLHVRKVFLMYSYNLG